MRVHAHKDAQWKNRPLTATARHTSSKASETQHYYWYSGRVPQPVGGNAKKTIDT